MPNSPRAPLAADGTCTRCGVVHLTKRGGPACAGHTTKGRACTKPPNGGMDVCNTHGGATTRARVAARRRLAADAATRAKRQLLEHYDVEPIEDPVELFQTVVAEARAMQLFLLDRAADLERQITGESHEGYEYLRAVLVEYRKATNDVAKLLEVWMRLDLDERITRATERQVAQVAQALELTARELGFGEAAARAVFGRHLRAIEGGAA